MKGDFTRDTFDPAKHFSRVLMQQGRVTVDADFNEQAAILLHYVRALARDLIGPYAGPVENGGFVLRVDDQTGLQIGAGRYYVDGILVENEIECDYDAQPNYSLPEGDPFQAELQKPSGEEFWLYLDVWERHVTALDDDSIREKALGGPDTCTRSKIVWQVKALAVETAQKGAADKIKKLKAEQAKVKKAADAAEGPLKEELQAKLKELDAAIAAASKDGTAKEMACDTPLADLVGLGAAALAARIDPGQQVVDACITPPESKYRGTENQLYRVEIHDGGAAGEATFKWSRDNGSAETAWLSTSGNDLEVASTRGFCAGDWIELSYDDLELHGQTGVLVRLAQVEGGVLSVDPASLPAGDSLVWPEKTNPRIRRWNQSERIRRWNQSETEDIAFSGGVVPVSEPTAQDDAWIDLEDGIQIQFGANGVYRSGDYWLIPARVATGGIEWPLTTDANDETVASLLPPRGVAHHFAPLGFVSWSDEKWQIRPCQCDFEPLSSCFVRAAADATKPPHVVSPASPPKTAPGAVVATPSKVTATPSRVTTTPPKVTAVAGTAAKKTVASRKKKPTP